MANANKQHPKGDTRSSVGEQPGRDDAGVVGGQQGGLGGTQQGSRDDTDAQQLEEIPHGGVNPEVGDMDAEADPDRDPRDDDNSLPGKMGGGLMGG